MHTWVCYLLTSPNRSDFVPSWLCPPPTRWVWLPGGNIRGVEECRAWVACQWQSCLQQGKGAFLFMLLLAMMTMLSQAHFHLQFSWEHYYEGAYKGQKNANTKKYERPANISQRKFGVNDLKFDYGFIFFVKKTCFLFTISLRVSDPFFHYFFNDSLRL